MTTRPRTSKLRLERLGLLGQKELPIIPKSYDLVKWYVPILHQLPRDHKFNLGDRIIQHDVQVLGKSWSYNN